MTTQHQRLTDLFNDTTCLLMMKRDGVQARAVYRMMRSVKSVIPRASEEVLDIGL